MTTPLTAPAAPDAPAAPMRPADARVTELDALRGVAVLGILVVNMPIFGGPWPARERDPWTAPWDRAAYHVTDVLFAGKFFTLFSLLFGLGLALQGERAAAAGADVRRFYRRRLGGLLAIGLVHAALFSTIDILVQYALLGFVLVRMRDWPPQRLARVAIALLAVPLLAVIAAVATGHAQQLNYWPSYADAQRAIAAYGHGAGASQFFRARGRDLAGYYVWVATTAGWQMLGMFVLGLWAERRGVLRDLPGHAPWFRALARVALPAGLAAAVAHRALSVSLWSAPERVAAHPLLVVASAALEYVAEPTLSLGYVGALALLFQRTGAGARLASRLAAVGRTALSQYVLQSVVMGALFFTWGLGLYGRLSPAATFALAFGLYALQVPLARAWLARYRFGPIEWAWRAFTYRTRPAMRRA